MTLHYGDIYTVERGTKSQCTDFAPQDVSACVPAILVKDQPPGSSEAYLLFLVPYSGATLHLYIPSSDLDRLFPGHLVFLFFLFYVHPLCVLLPPPMHCPEYRQSSQQSLHSTTEPALKGSAWLQGSLQWHACMLQKIVQFVLLCTVYSFGVLTLADNSTCTSALHYCSIAPSPV